MKATITTTTGETITREETTRPEAFAAMIAADGIRLELAYYSPITRSERTEHYQRYTDGYTYAEPSRQSHGASHASRPPMRVIDHGDDAGRIDRTMFDYPTSATCQPGAGARPLISRAEASGLDDERTRELDETGRDMRPDFAAEAPSYARLLLADNPRPFWLRIETETEHILQGIEVRADGDEVIPRGRDGAGRRYTERRHVIDKAAIKTRTPARMSARYGELETIETPATPAPEEENVQPPAKNTSEASAMRTRYAIARRDGAGGHLLAWSRDAREPVTDQQAESIARGLDPETIEAAADATTRANIARDILNNAAMLELAIYREWVEAGETPAPAPAPLPHAGRTHGETPENAELAELAAYTARTWEKTDTRARALAMLEHAAGQALNEAAMHRTHEGFVSYRDTGAAVYLAYHVEHTRDHIDIISDDGRRTLAEIPTEARTIAEAAAEIRRHINTTGKPYGEHCTPALWSAGDASEPTEAPS